MQVFTSAMSQVAHAALQQLAPENPSGHAMHVFSSLMSQAVHAALQAEKEHASINDGITNIICYAYLLHR